MAAGTKSKLTVLVKKENIATIEVDSMSSAETRDYNGKQVSNAMTFT